MEKIEIGNGFYNSFIVSREYLKQENLIESELPASILVVGTEEERTEEINKWEQKRALDEYHGDNTAKWIVKAKGEVGKPGFEISILRENNNLGKRSHGWFGDTKILISNDGPHMHLALEKSIWDKMIILAQEVADEKNKIEGLF